MNIHRSLVIGLGNPGAEYEDTYHNVGALALENILGAESPDEKPEYKKYKKFFEYLETPHAIFVRPLTFMNESGIAVKEALKKFDASPEDIIVLHDDSDLTVGNFKISTEKNSAGHNGVQSIIDHLDTNAFKRVRIGIRATNELTRKKALDFVLARITNADQEKLQIVFEEIAKALKLPPQMRR